MRVLAVIVMLLGIASIVFGVIFVTQGIDGKQEVEESIAPLPLDQLDAQYDTVTDQYKQMKAAGAPPDAQFNYLYATKTGLGLARANKGTAEAVMYNGIVDICVGAGLVLGGLGLLRKSSA
jgi:uncharacterized membrane protein YphA (DoxX/SURF4 family)